MALCRIGAHDAVQRAIVEISGRRYDRASAYCRDCLLRRDAVLLQLVRIERDNDGPLIAAEGWRRRDPWQSRKQWPYLIEGDVLEFALSMCGTGEEEQTNGYAPRIEARDERRNRAGRHEGPSSSDVADRLRHCLLHVGSFTKGQLHQRGALNALAIDRLNTCDVEEVVVVVVGKEPFHLRRSHTAIRLRYVDDGVAHLRKDVCAHSAKRHDESNQDRDQRDDHSKRAS